MQAEELAYVIVTPYSMRKSRTGGIISRLISRTGLDLVAGRMFAPSDELVRRFSETIVTATEPRHRATQELIRDYVRKNFTGTGNGQRPRVLMLVFRGPDAIETMRRVVGHIEHERTSGETVRDTYGDYITDESGKVTYFEPGVIAAFGNESVEQGLKLWSEFSDSDGGILDRVIAYPQASNVEKTLVLIKPDNFKFPNLRPGGVIEVFSRTGLYIVGFKVHRMSVAQAKEFYGPVLPVLEDKLGGEKGRGAWEDIVEFMSGGRPSVKSEDQHHEPGTEKIVALVYQGEDAVKKIRDVLGPTDPSKAPPGSIRKEFGQSIMVNAAHASDSAENAQREMKIVQIDENNFKPLIESFYKRQ
ncbi:MAG: nucleoside-diphosphate kinase [Verrucomicrobiota bacterium]|nr:nucleoside-diphosphate kinase [Verrucomicrobiota bacterium]MDQ6939568.1 nucleoside-diphosphate kinase [Verrucomicrobiota bacterium]